MELKIGNIVLIPFPFTDLSSSKRRPALIIGVFGDDLIVLAITSKETLDNALLIRVDDFLTGSIPLISYLRLNKIATLHKSIVRKSVAKLKKDFLEKILMQFKDQF